MRVPLARFAYTCVRLRPLHCCSVIDLLVLAFLALRRRFFDEHGHPVSFELRDKGSTQDDPLDEFLARDVFAGLNDVICRPAPGPLITPDMVLHRPLVNRLDDLTQIVGIEVKKIERSKGGASPGHRDWISTRPRLVAGS